MSVLTKKERDGLEEVFLSINRPINIFKKMKEISLLIINNILKQATYGFKGSKIQNILAIAYKKKKNLSK